jgi:hypothetical protein
MNDWVQKAGHTSEVFDFPSDIHRFLQAIIKHQSSQNIFQQNTLKNHHRKS